MQSIWQRFCEFMLRERHLISPCCSSEADSSGTEPVRYAVSYDDRRDDKWMWGPQDDFNPATGLPMMGLVDICGNPFGRDDTFSSRPSIFDD